MKMLVRSSFVGAAAVAALLAAAPALAGSVTGTVNVNGTVTGTCIVAGGGSTFGGGAPDISLGELDDPTTGGKLKASLHNSTSGIATAAGTAQYTVTCNTGAPAVTLSATSLQNSGPSGGGYTNTVDYTAELDINLAAGGHSTTTYVTPSGPQAGDSTLSGPIATTTNNVLVQVYALGTDGGADSSVLDSGGYGTPGGVSGSGVIHITISPS